MPTRTAKSGKKTATKQTTTKKTATRQTATKKSPKKAVKQQRTATLTPLPPPPPPPALDSDPPIIVSGGGSVTIYSPYPFEQTPAVGDYPYVYYSSEASITWMTMEGKKGKQKDESNDGLFNVKLYKK